MVIKPVTVIELVTVIGPVMVIGPVGLIVSGEVGPWGGGVMW